MPISKLIIGADDKKRLQQANIIINNLNIAPIDVFLIKDENSITLSNIITLIKELNRTPLQSSMKAAIIHPGDNMTIEAQNSLLKTLEEPPRQRLIIITAKSLEKILPTLVSRCQIITLPSSLNKKSIHSAVELLAKIANSSTGDLLLMASQPTTRQAALHVIEQLTITIREFILIKHRLSRDNKESKDLIELMNELAIVQKPNKLLINMLKQLNLSQKALEANVNPRLTMEILFLKLAGMFHS